MPELRYDPLEHRWVIIATERAARPSDLADKTKYNSVKVCPFCEGHETSTPPEIWAYRDPKTPPNSPGWDVRVVSNKFPALKIEAKGKRIGVGYYDMIEGAGAHEVIIETPEHELGLPDLPPSHIKWILLAYRERIKDLYKDPRFRYALVFKNHGQRAGASLAHPHSQLIATPIVPRNVFIKLDAARNHYETKERCLICDLIQQEISTGSRIIAKENGFVAIAPYASRFPFEVFIAPIEHNHNYADISNDDLEKFSHFFKDILFRIKKILSDPPYNFVLNTSPNTEAQPKRPDQWGTLKYDYHWHIDIIPRVVRIAGFEWGSGFYINPSVPEEAAKYLRESGKTE
jgi:UDPglucose--hexose-1-phosphate uridylyltransferase